MMPTSDDMSIDKVDMSVCMSMCDLQLHFLMFS